VDDEFLFYPQLANNKNADNGSPNVTIWLYFENFSVTETGGVAAGWVQ
jgi:hypothetical protein